VTQRHSIPKKSVVSNISCHHVQLLDRLLRVSPVVLIHSAGDREHNAAVVLHEVLAERKFVSELPRGA
jgi:uncharacterized protein YeaO (DUF488 family)